MDAIPVCVGAAVLEIEDAAVFEAAVEPTVNVAAEPPEVVSGIFKAAAGEHNAGNVVDVKMGASGSGKQ